MTDIELLKQAASAQYLDKGTSTLTDEEYDALESKLGVRGITLIGDYKEMKVKTFSKKHQIKSDFQDKVNSLTEGIILPKWDGCSLVAYYLYAEERNKSVLVKVVSKSSGLDKTKNYSKYFPSEVSGMVRYIQGEACVDLSFGFGEKSRQKANGLVNSKFKAKEITKYISVNLFSYYDGKSVRAITPNIDSFSLTDTVRPSYDYRDCKVDGNRLTTPDGKMFLIDGVVHYTTDDVQAYKFYFTDAATTKVIDIKWQKSKYDMYTPVAILDPVIVEGCKISKTSVGSTSKMVSRGIGIGSEVSIVRSNSTIPKIDKVITKSADYGKSSCPYCGERFSMSHLIAGKTYCRNPRCSRYQSLAAKLDKSAKTDADIKSYLKLDARTKLTTTQLEQIRTSLLTGAPLKLNKVVPTAKLLINFKLDVYELYKNPD